MLDEGCRMGDAGQMWQGCRVRTWQGPRDVGHWMWGGDWVGTKDAGWGMQNGDVMGDAGWGHGVNQG